jgi:pimeloyl-ACP methyl ester carboxylesterase
MNTVSAWAGPLSTRWRPGRWLVAKTISAIILAGYCFAAAAVRADTPRPGVACAAFPGNPDPTKVYGLQTQTCDVTDMAIAVHDGNFRSLYGAEADYGSTHVQEILAILDGVDGRLRAAALAGESAQKTCGTAGGPCRVTLKVMMFAHGGLVGQDDAIAEAQAIAPGALADGYLPLFLIWNSDLAGAYGERLCCVYEGEKSERGLPYFFPIRFLGDLAAGVSRAPEYYGEQVIRFHDSVIEKKGTQYYLSRSDQDQLCGVLGPATCGHIDYPPFAAYRELNALDQPIEEQSPLYPLLFPVRLGTTAIGSQVGAQAWDDLVRRTRLALQPPLLDIVPKIAARVAPAGDPCDAQTRGRLDDVESLKAAGAALDDTPGEGRFDVGAEGAFAVFADHLDCEIAHNLGLDPGRTRVDVRIDFYGHSMGAIVGDQLISAYPDLPWRRIVYMAAADSTRDFRSTVAPLLACAGDGPRSRCLAGDATFHNLMLHPLAESHDLEFWGLLPEGSLLEWIDEMFGGPRSVDDRTFGKWTNVEKSMAFLPTAARRRMYFRVFPAQQNLRDGDQDEKALYAAECTSSPGSGQRPIRCHPTVHGDFTHYSFWRDAFLCDPADKIAVCP